jgi:hypothetical protein
MPESMIEGRSFDRFRLARKQGMSHCIESTPFDELHGTVSGDLLKSRVQCPGADARELAESVKREGFREVVVFKVSTHLSHVSPMVPRRQRGPVRAAPARGERETNTGEHRLFYVPSRTC